MLHIQSCLCNGTALMAPGSTKDFFTRMLATKRRYLSYVLLSYIYLETTLLAKFIFEEFDNKTEYNNRGKTRMTNVCEEKSFKAGLPK